MSARPAYRLSRPRRLGPGLLALAALACDGGPVDPADRTPASVVPRGGDAQTAPVGAPVPIPPSVVVLDPDGRPVAEVTVVFEVVQGGGEVLQPVQVTGDDGVAQVGGWILGPQPGTQALAAAVEGVGTVELQATARAGAPDSLALVLPAPDTGQVGRPVVPAPGVRVLDEFGNGVPGVAVTFEVLEGGGAVEPDTVVTDAQGVAAPDRWVLGPEPGINVLQARAEGLGVVRFTVTAGPVPEPGPPERLRVVAGADQSAPVDRRVPVRPAVLVEDSVGIPVPGVDVRFEVVAGGGSISSEVVTTEESGVAALERWVLGPEPGVNRLRATVSGADTVDVLATAVAPGGYHMQIRTLGALTRAQSAAVQSARQRWNGIIVGDVPDVVGFSAAADACVDGQPAITEDVDDLIIFVRFDSIDGRGGTLGSAGPCYVRSASRLPLVGVINLDEEDLVALEQNGLLETVVLHEMGHALGIGTLWETLDLLVGDPTVDPRFVGPAAIEAFDAIGGAVYDGVPVPVENTGGAGTAGGHWRESVLANELMTGFLDRPPNPLSLLTVASLADLGYAVDLSAADAFTVPVAGPAALRAAGIRLRETPLPPPLRVTPEGRVLPPPGSAAPER